MSRNRIIVLKKFAIKRLPAGDRIHTFRQSGPMMIGADWARADILKLFEKHVIYETGPKAQGMNHGLAIIDDIGALFIETKPQKKKESRGLLIKPGRMDHMEVGAAFGKPIKAKEG